MTATIRVLAGDCTVIEDEGGDRCERRGRVVVVGKPDGTVLVHDRDGYQPVAWLTRADAVTWGFDPGGERESDDGSPDFALAAHKGDTSLRVAVHEETGLGRYPASAAGTPVGACPTCEGTFVRSGTGVACTGCGDEYGLPEGATVRDEDCTCGRPRIRTERGTAFDLCLDRDCAHSSSLDEAVREAFDGAWDCPACGTPMGVIRRRGLMVGCERYPECDTGFVIPTGTVVGECACGLPAFETARGRRCLDATCPHEGTAAEDGTAPDDPDRDGSEVDPASSRV